MFAEIMIALSAALLLGTAMAAVAIINHEANASLAALDPQKAPAAVHAKDWVAGYDTNGTAALRSQLTRTCRLRPTQQSHC
jgi:hypothetical protein